MNREFHVRFCEGLGVKVPRATRLATLTFRVERKQYTYNNETEPLLTLPLNHIFGS